jgi:hypothetical protein
MDRRVAGWALIGLGVLVGAPLRRVPELEENPALRALALREISIATTTATYNPWGSLKATAPRQRDIRIDSLVLRRSAMDTLFGIASVSAAVEYVEDGSRSCAKLTLFRPADARDWLARRARVKPGACGWF